MPRHAWGRAAATPFCWRRAAFPHVRRPSMFRLFLAAALTLVPLAARAQAEQQAVVDRATLTVQEIISRAGAQDPQSLLKRSRAVMICPQVFRAAFIFGGSGGDCVLV